MIRSPIRLATLVSLTLLLGCASIAPNGKGARVEGILDGSCCPDKNGIRVFNLGRKALSNGLRDEDVLIEANGRPLDSGASRASFLNSIYQHPRGRFAVRALRGDKVVRADVRPRATKILQRDAFFRELWKALSLEEISRSSLTVAMIVDEIRIQGYDRLSRQGASLRGRSEYFSYAEDITNKIESFLTQFSSCENTRIVDRRATSTILEELVIAQTGIISPESAIKVGQMAQASHLLLVSVEVWPDQSADSHQTTIRGRLIDVASGSVRFAFSQTY